MDTYYSIDKLSQSRLNVVKCVRDGSPFIKVKKETLDFGHQMHEAVLQAKKYAINLLKNPEYKINRHKIAAMVKAAKDNAVLQMYLKDPESIIEDDHFFNESRYNLECKLRADIRLNYRKTVLDLKSTSATTKEEFEAIIKQYGYHRQGAFYLDGTDCETFIIIAISKKSPHKTFTYIFRWDDPLILEGQKENEDLIDYYLQNKDKINFNELMKAA